MGFQSKVSKLPKVTCLYALKLKTGNGAEGIWGFSDSQFLLIPINFSLYFLLLKFPNLENCLPSLSLI